MNKLIKHRDLLREKAYINGHWITGNGRVFSVLNPFDENEIVKVPDLGKEETTQAIEAAHRAFPHWSTVLVADRAKKLFLLADLLEKYAEDLAVLLTLEQGKTLTEAKEEVFSSASVIRWFAEESRRIHGFTQCDPDETRSVMTLRQPVGVVGIITPWNFPLDIPVQKCCAAIAAGCTVVLKPAEDTPLCALALAYLSQEAGIPPGVFNVVTCKDPKEVGEVITSHPLVTKVTFTGSTEVGKKILALCAPTVKKVTMELGGNCPFIVFEDADLEKTLQAALSLKFYNSGQCCNSINRFLVHHSVHDTFIQMFSQKAKNLSCKSGLESPDLGPLINRQGKEKVEELVEDASQKGAEIVLQLKKDSGLLCSPIVIKNMRKDMRLFKEEVFGPVAAFYSFDSEKEAIDMANDTRYGLAAYLFTENLARSMRIMKALEAGSIGINTTNVYSITLPFGGWKESGLGREGGIVESLNEYCELKAISIAK